MNFEVISAADMSQALCGEWRTLQHACTRYASPLFSVELLQTVAKVRPDVQVAVLHDGRTSAGFLAWHRSRSAVAAPIAAHFTDLQGPLLAPHAALDVRKLIEAAQLRGAVFSGWLDEQDDERQGAVSCEVPYIDLSAGFDAYQRERRAAGGDELQNLLRKTRKAERELGPLRLDIDAPDPQLLTTLMQWKARQLRAQRQPSALNEDWQTVLLHHLLQVRSPDCTGLLSTLHAGEDLLALSFSLRSRTVLSGWVTAYNEAFARYSPGMLLLLALLRKLPELGVQRIDLGRGEESYKRILRSGGTPVRELAVYARPWQSALHSARRQAEQWVRRSRWGASAQTLSRRLRWARSCLRDAHPIAAGAAATGAARAERH